MPLKRLSTILFSLALSQMLTPPALGAIIQVPSDYATIQAAVNAAGTTDTVLVAPGVYQENILIDSKSIHLASHYLLDQNPNHLLTTIIDGSNPTNPDTGSVVILLNATSAVLQGFTLTGGTGTVWEDQSDHNDFREGGGVLTEGGSPSIVNNLIMGNKAILTAGVTSAGGGGIRCGYGTPLVANNVFGYNQGHYGGAIVLFHAPTTIRNNIVFENSGGKDFGGGGIWITSAGGTPTVANNTIINNRSTTDGGGLLLWANSVSLSSNIIRNNTAATTGPQVKMRAGATSSTVTYSNVEGGISGLGNIDSPSVFDLSAYVLDPISPDVDAGNPQFGLNDPAIASVAVPPSQGGSRNDMGAYGGPERLPFPQFNSPGIDIESDSIDIGSIDVGMVGQAVIRITKASFGMARFDSIGYSDSSLFSLAESSSVPLLTGPLGIGVVDSIVVEWSPVTYGSMQDTIFVFHSDAVVSSPIQVIVTGTAPGMTGDVNMDGTITASDIIYFVNHVFKGGPAPLPVPEAGDVNCDQALTSADVIYLVNYVFKGGPGPC